MKSIHLNLHLQNWDQREHAKAIWANNPTCMGWYFAPKNNNPRGPVPNYNPDEIEDFIARIERYSRTPEAIEIAEADALTLTT